MHPSELHKKADAFFSEVFRRNPAAKHCCEGCRLAHCCYEPAYADTHEIKHAVDLLSEEQREQVKQRLPDWLAKVQPLLATEMPGALPYRRLQAPCPLLNLETNECMAYDRRPFGCRSFFARENPEHCALEHRERQQYGEFPGSYNVLAEYFFSHQTLEMDHIGALLIEALTGTSCETESRKKYGMD